MSKRESPIVPPTPERMRHDLIGPYKARALDSSGKLIEVETIQDSDGGIGRPFNVVGTVSLLNLRGEISDACASAAFAFMDDFDVGRIHPLRAAQFEIQGKGREELSHRVLAARNRVWRARKALILGSPIESAAWNILGMRRNISEWCANEGHRFSRATAKRLLIEATQVLADTYGYEKASISHITERYQLVPAIRRGRQRNRFLAQFV